MAMRNRRERTAAEREALTGTDSPHGPDDGLRHTKDVIGGGPSTLSARIGAPNRHQVSGIAAARGDTRRQLWKRIYDMRLPHPLTLALRHLTPGRTIDGVAALPVWLGA